MSSMELDHRKKLVLKPGIQVRISKYITQFSVDVVTHASTTYRFLVRRSVQVWTNTVHISILSSNEKPCRSVFSVEPIAVLKRSQCYRLSQLIYYTLLPKHMKKLLNITFLPFVYLNLEINVNLTITSTK